MLTMALAFSYTQPTAPHPSIYNVCVPFPLPYACLGWLEPLTNTKHLGMWIKQISHALWRFPQRPPYGAHGLLRGLCFVTANSLATTQPATCLLRDLHSRAHYFVNSLIDQNDFMCF
jgi:hypothetical protein